MTDAAVSGLDFNAVKPALHDLVLSALVRERFRPSEVLDGWAARQLPKVLTKLSADALDVALALGEATGKPTEAQGGELPLSLRCALLARAGIDLVRKALDRDPPQTLAERTFAALVRGDPLDPTRMNSSELLALTAAASWAAGLPGATQVSAAEVERRIRDREFVERVGGADLGLFVGRDALLRALARIWALPDRPVVLIEGPGGIGKSIAVARFFQSLLSGEDGLTRPDAILHLDFDLPHLQAATAMDLTVEVVRQLALRWTTKAQDELLSLLRGFGGVGKELASENFTSRKTPSFDSFRSQRSYTTHERVLAEALRRFAAGRDTPLRLVLFADSFERVDRFDELVSQNMAKVDAALRAAGADVMVIYAARAYYSPDELGQGRRPAIQRVPRFSQGQAVDYLVAKAQVQGITLSRQDAARANRAINGWPLGLRIAVSMLATSREAFDARKWLAALSTGGRSVQATLYERLLDRIHDRDLKKLAKPGLLVRRVSAEVITQVLAKPCGLSGNVNGAELLRKAEAEGQLFVRDLSDPGALWHRQDLREVMLPVLRIDVPEPLATAIHNNAVSFYETEVGVVARAEELYHRLCRGDARAVVAERWQHAAGQRLRSAIAELPPAGAATMRLLLGGGRSEETGYGSDADVEELRAVAQNRLAEGDTRLSDLFTQAGVLEAVASPLGDIHAAVLVREGRFEEVIAEAEALRGDRRVPASVKARVAITAAGLAEGLLDLNRATSFWKDAARLSRHLQPLEHLTVRIGLSRVLRKVGAQARRRRRQASTACDLLLANGSAVRSHRVLRLEAVAELSDILPIRRSNGPYGSEKLGLAVALLDLFRLLSPMYPSAMLHHARFLEVARLLGAEPEYVSTPYELEKLTAQVFNDVEQASHGRALAALRSEVDFSFAAAVRGAAAGIGPDQTSMEQGLSYS